MRRTVGGGIAGTGSVVVDSNATVYLNGANTYAGSTTVQSGVLGGNGTISGLVGSCGMPSQRGGIAC